MPSRESLYGVAGSRSSVSAADSSASGIEYARAGSRLIEFTCVFSQSLTGAAAETASAAKATASIKQTSVVFFILSILLRKIALNPITASKDRETLKARRHDRLVYGKSHVPPRQDCVDQIQRASANDGFSYADDLGSSFREAVQPLRKHALWNPAKWRVLSAFEKTKPVKILPVSVFKNDS